MCKITILYFVGNAHLSAHYKVLTYESFVCVFLTFYFLAQIQLTWEQTFKKAGNELLLSFCVFSSTRYEDY